MQKITQSNLSKKPIRILLVILTFATCLQGIVEHPFHTQETNWEPEAILEFVHSIHEVLEYFKHR